VISFGLIVAMGLWVPAMQTLALVLVAGAVAVLIAIPLGIWSARNATVRAVLKPALDFMQTMPAFVYLIPAIVFFSIGVVPGLVATVIFALPPGVRFTELGIRGVDSETVEAGQSFGATPGQILRGIQLPLAMPTILAGVNQVIMLSLSMAVIAGMAGADGLGKLVVEAISTVNIAKGVEAGLGVVLIAVFLDRVTASLGSLGEHPASLLGMMARRRTARRLAAAPAVAVTTPEQPAEEKELQNA
jgi:glycine betaine/proline transport system permease protein